MQVSTRAELLDRYLYLFTTPYLEPSESFETGIRKTVKWYLCNNRWIQQVVSGAYRDWIQGQYAERPAAGPREHR